MSVDALLGHEPRIHGDGILFSLRICQTAHSERKSQAYRATDNTFERIAESVVAYGRPAMEFYDFAG
jgi:hypothetical protein